MDTERETAVNDAASWDGPASWRDASSWTAGDEASAGAAARGSDPAAPSGVAADASRSGDAQSWATLSPLMQLVAAVGGTGDVFGAAQATRRAARETAVHAAREAGCDASSIDAALEVGLAESTRMARPSTARHPFSIGDGEARRVARGTEQSRPLRKDLAIDLSEASAALVALAFARKPSEMRASINVDSLDEIQFGRGSSERIAVPAIESPATTTAEPPATSRIDLPSSSLARAPRRNRRTRARSQTIAMKRVSRAERAAYAEKFPVSDVQDLQRPRTRAECKQQEGPCPWVACKHHLYLDINPLTGSIKLNFPDLEPWELEHTCALDVAEAGALTLEQVGAITNLTRERVRQVEVIGLAKLGASARRHGLR